MSFDVAHRVMDFMDENNLKPSKALIKKYRKSKTTDFLNLPPSKEKRRKMGMDEYWYSNILKKVYRRKIIKNKIE